MQSEVLMDNSVGPSGMQYMPKNCCPELIDSSLITHRLMRLINRETSFQVVYEVQNMSFLYLSEVTKH